MKTMADLIEASLQMSDAGSLAQASLIRALQATGPIGHKRFVWTVESGMLCRTPIELYVGQRWSADFWFHPADQVPIPTGEPVIVRTTEITDGEFLTIGPAAASPWRDFPCRKSCVNLVLNAYRLPASAVVAPDLGSYPVSDPEPPLL